MDVTAVLGTYSRPDLEIELKHCQFTGAGASAGGGPGRKGPTKLDFCEIDMCCTREWVTRKLVVWKIEQLLYQNFDVGNRVRTVAGALEKRGLVACISYMDLRWTKNVGMQSAILSRSIRLSSC
jgi:hypothetical protein